MCDIQTYCQIRESVNTIQRSNEPEMKQAYYTRRWISNNKLGKSRLNFSRRVEQSGFIFDLLESDKKDFMFPISSS